MKKIISLLLLSTFYSSHSTWAQLRAPNEAGVSLGQWHTIVRDVAATEMFWITLGGTPIEIDGTKVIKFPGVFIFLTPGTPSGGTKGSTVNHIGMAVDSVKDAYEKWKAAGLNVEEPRKSPLNGQDITDVFTPDNVMVEITQAGVAPYASLPPGATIESNHMHLFVPDSARQELQAWYAKMFGGTTGVLRGELIVDLPGVKFIRIAPCGSEYSGCKDAPAPTKGRALDHIGFEVNKLQAFCKKLQASGVKFVEPYSKTRHKSSASAEITDAWGTLIELTEGLNRF